MEIKPEARWEIEQGLALSALDVYEASKTRSAWYQTVRRLFETYDVLVLPTAQVFPFDADVHWPVSIAGRTMDTYHRWMEVTLYATFAGLPAISVPAGFDNSGRLPMGLQLIGRPHGDAALLTLAAAYEERIADLLQRRPPEL
jgi:amidase